MKRVIIALTTILAALAFLTPTTANAAPPESARWVGEDDWGGWINILSATSYSDSVVFDVDIQATKGQMPFNPFYFVAKTADGYRYNSPTYRGDNHLTSELLPAGDRLRGTIELQVTGPRPTILIYQGVLGAQLAKWTLTWKPTPKPKTPPSPFGSLGS
ncbi:hypothetical protein [Gordonia alkanivorans]|uniref:hypothetical protein n=1 Tax=Gordonia alkanivorans TaxID=84096 RepID=UPI0024B6796F|nr:hypothetical protein [Gordonia alkanivorans]MDJ0010150.1 hypothetical protein [Gordonia alkanivorans]MDJ0495660.1 hypothetical protein [Gordonia alkanivorans]